MTYCLVIGQSSNYSDIARLMGKGMGCDVQVANDWFSAVKLCRERLPDLVVVDVQEIDIEDMQHLATLRSLPGGESTHIIVCSNDNTTKGEKHALQMGASAYLPKPYYPKQLMEKFLQSEKIS